MDPAPSPARLPFEVVEELRRADQVVLASGAGHRRRTPVVVVVDDLDVYLRPLGEARADVDADLTHSPRAQVHVQGTAVEVSAERVTDPASLAAVDDAYRDTFGARRPDDPTSFLTPAAVASTWRLHAG